MSKKFFFKQKSTQEFLDNVIKQYQKERHDLEQRSQVLNDDKAIPQMSESRTFGVARASKVFNDEETNEEDFQFSLNNFVRRSSYPSMSFQNPINGQASHSLSVNKKKSTQNELNIQRRNSDIANVSRKDPKLEFVRPVSGCAKSCLKAYEQDNENRNFIFTANESKQYRSTQMKKPSSYNEGISLALPADKYFLPPFQCFTRKYLVEIFVATSTDIEELSNRRKIQVGQVGIRCPRCVSLPVKDRALRYSCYPSNISRIYQNVEEFRKHHFDHCSEIPNDIRNEYQKFLEAREDSLLSSDASGQKVSQRRTKSQSKYWIESAQELGLFDTENGIRLNPNQHLQSR